MKIYYFEEILKCGNLYEGYVVDFEFDKLVFTYGMNGWRTGSFSKFEDIRNSHYLGKKYFDNNTIFVRVL